MYQGIELLSGPAEALAAAVPAVDSARGGDPAALAELRDLMRQVIITTI